jgi:hypothetical protein
VCWVESQDHCETTRILRLNGSAGGDGRLSGWELYGYDRRGTTIHELESIGGEVADIVDNKN